MSEVQQQQVESNEVEENNQDISLQTLQAELEAKNKEFEAVKSKMDQLLDETKKAKAARREAEAAAKAEAEAKARKEGDFEQLLKSSEEERNKLAEELNSLRSNVTSEKINNEALKIASELADGANAEILSEFVKRRLQWTDEGIKVTDGNGNLTIATIDQLKNEFTTSEKFKSLIRGNKSTGSGATGSSDGVAEVKTMSRGDFEGLHPAKQMEFLKKGGKLTNQTN